MVTWLSDMAILPNLVAFQFSRIRRPPYIFPTVSRPFPISENQELEMHQMPRVDGLSPPPSAKMNCQPMGPFFVQKLNLNPGHLLFIQSRVLMCFSIFRNFCNYVHLDTWTWPVRHIALI